MPFGDAFRKVKRGESLRIPATAYNAFIDAALAHQRTQQDVGAPSIVARAGQVTVKVRNDSGGNRAQFDILKLGSPIVLPTASTAEFARQVTFAGVAPDGKANQVAILQEPIPTGAIGQALLWGVTPCRIDVNHAKHTHAQPASGNYRLQSSFGGAARILWKESGTGSSKWAYLLYGPVTARTLLAKGAIPAASDTAPGSASVAVWMESATPGTWEASGATVTALNFSKTAVSASVWLELDFHEDDGEFHCKFEDCPAS